jgi:hypothetical protein
MFSYLLDGSILKCCELDHLGIQVENGKIVTPGVKLQFEETDPRHGKVLLDGKIIGNFSYILQMENEYLRFMTTNNDSQERINFF